jgi:hypothetical protein
MLMRKTISATSPDIVVEINGSKYTVSTITTLKTIKIEFTLGATYEADPGTGKKGNYITTLEGNSLVTKDAGSGNVAAKREFSDSGMVMTMYADGVVATRTFKRA